MEYERLLLLAYLYENGGPHFEQNLFLAHEHYSKLSLGQEEIYYKGKQDTYIPLFNLRQEIERNLKSSAPSLLPFKAILTEYAF